MKLATPKKAIIRKVDEYDISLQGDSTHYTAKTKEDAERIAQKIEAQSKKEADEYNDTDKKKLDIFHNLMSYPEHLKKQLWHLQRNKTATKEHIEDIKRIMKELEGILAGKMRLNWHQSYLNDSTYYSVDKKEASR